MRGVLLIVCLFIAGCGRASITFALGAGDEPLTETAVITDPGADAKVALIEFRGVITDARRPGILSDGFNPVDEFVARLGKAEADPGVRAVVIRINSPGGSVTASDTLYSEVRRFREKTGKPVVASLSEVAASGGYYLALACDEIVTQPTTITGSIGVIIPTVNVSGGMQRIGIVSRAVKSGPNKDLANPLEPMREEQYAVLQGMVDEFYARFRGLVEERRGEALKAANSPTPIEHLTDGRIVSGAEAVRTGLADREGGLREAFEVAKERAKLGGARLVKYHDRGDTPRSAYAESDLPPAAGAAPVEVSLLRIDGAGLGAGLAPGNAYYLWDGGMAW